MVRRDRITNGYLKRSHSTGHGGKSVGNLSGPGGFDCAAVFLANTAHTTAARHIAESTSLAAKIYFLCFNVAGAKMSAPKWEAETGEEARWEQPGAEGVAAYPYTHTAKTKGKRKFLSFEAGESFRLIKQGQKVIVVVFCGGPLCGSLSLS